MEEFAKILDHVELVDEDEFICQNCEGELYPQFVEYMNPFSKKGLLDCERGDGDFSPLGISNDTHIMVSCSCGKAKLAHCDIELLCGYCEEIIVEGEPVMHDNPRL